MSEIKMQTLSFQIPQEFESLSNLGILKVYDVLESIAYLNSLYSMTAAEAQKFPDRQKIVDLRKQVSYIIEKRTAEAQKLLEDVPTYLGGNKKND